MRRWPVYCRVARPATLIARRRLGPQRLARRERISLRPAPRNSAIGAQPPRSPAPHAPRAIIATVWRPNSVSLKTPVGNRQGRFSPYAKTPCFSCVSSGATSLGRDVMLPRNSSFSAARPAAGGGEPGYRRAAGPAEVGRLRPAGDNPAPCAGGLCCNDPRKTAQHNEPAAR